MKTFLEPDKYLVCFIPNGGGLAIAFTCSEKDKSFWEKEGRIIVDNDGSIFPIKR